MMDQPAYNRPLLRFGVGYMSLLDGYLTYECLGVHGGSTFPFSIGERCVLADT